MPYKDVRKQRTSEQRWLTRNPEKRKEIAKRYRAAHPEKCRANTRTWRERNRERAEESRKRWVKANPVKMARQRRRAALKRKFNLTPEDVDNLLLSQGGTCAICDELVALPCVDHCHETGQIRGALCSRCNTGLGHMRDNPQLLRAAADYLDRSVKARNRTESHAQNVVN